MSGSIVLLSGGLDSAVALDITIRRDAPIIALFFFYNQRAQDREYDAVIRLVRHYNIPLERQYINLPPGPTNCPSHHNTDPTFAPSRNWIMLAYAENLANVCGVDRIVAGFHADDVKDVTCYCRVRGFRINSTHYLAPLAGMTKTDIVKYALRHNVPFHLTYSCYEGGVQPCGVCKSCEARQTALSAAEAPDV